MNNNVSRPRIAVTIGDPAGIGPEVVLGALANHGVFEKSIPIIIGNAAVLESCMAQIGIKGLEIKSLADTEEACGTPGVIEVLDIPVPDIENIIPGKVQATAGFAADLFIRKSCELALEKRIDAISTAPINKESLRAAGVGEIGHTELLAKYLDAHDPLTLFITENMRIFFLSRHLSLCQAIDYITEDRLLKMIERVDRVMKELGFDSPQIGISALNPHASDGGQFGDEEGRIISPAISKACEMRIQAFGPVGADSIFHQALEGYYDCVISLYHDQGHIASKTRNFHETVTATLGLPVLRTSVDHGTGFDIAWQGKANSLSMKMAILAAGNLVKKKL